MTKTNREELEQALADMIIESADYFDIGQLDPELAAKAILDSGLVIPVPEPTIKTDNTHWSGKCSTCGYTSTFPNHIKEALCTNVDCINKKSFG